jgi:anti-anti-sigma factor
MNQTFSYPANPGAKISWGCDSNKEPELNLSLEVRTSDDIAVVVCNGRIVYCKEVAALSYAVADLLPQMRLLVLELSQVETIDGAGLGELLALRARARTHSCVISLVAPSKGVRELLDLTRVAAAFEIYSTVEEALTGARVYGPAVRRQTKSQSTSSLDLRTGDLRSGDYRSERTSVFDSRS